MPLQSSGAISLSQIKTELGSGSNSLRTLSAAAGKSTPDAFSEFYGYSAADVNFTFTGGSTSTSGKFASSFFGVDTIPFNTAFGSFSDSSAGGVTWKAIYHTTGSMQGAYVAVSGNYSGQSFSSVVGYRYLKIGSTIIFDSQGLDLIAQPVTGDYYSSTNVTRWYNNFSQTTTYSQQTALIYQNTHTVTLSN